MWAIHSNTQLLSVDSFCPQVVQLHVGKEMQPGTIERGAEKTGGEWSNARPQLLISPFSCKHFKDTNKYYTLEPRHIRSITLIHPKIC